MRRATTRFLLATARLNLSWFNRAKYHIIVHLPETLILFGPGALSATEGFESYNSIIRSQSVHSNRQAPSRDIALGFAQAYRVRHLMSGGYFWPEGAATIRTMIPVQAAQGPLGLVDTSPLLAMGLGLVMKREDQGERSTLKGELLGAFLTIFMILHEESVLFAPGQGSEAIQPNDNEDNTWAAISLKYRLSPNLEAPNSTFQLWKSAVLDNGEVCTVSSFGLGDGASIEVIHGDFDRSGIVVGEVDRGSVVLSIGLIAAILSSDERGKVDDFIVQRTLRDDDDRYQMPRLSVQPTWTLHKRSVRFITSKAVFTKTNSFDRIYYV